jgi:HK97 family phage major capsid protein
MKDYTEYSKVFKTYDTAGADINAWDTDMLPPEEWAGSIFEDAQAEESMLTFVKRRYDSPRKVTVPVQNHQSATWTSTAARDVRSNNDEMAYSAQGISLDPTRYRTYAEVTRDSLEEATWGVEQDLRNRLKNATMLKFNELIYSTLDGTSMSSGDYQTAGESLTNTTTGNAVDYGAGLTVDDVIDAIYNVRSTSYNFFKPNRVVLSAGLMNDIVKDSPVLNASERGNSTVINTGILGQALGCTFHIMGDMPQDSGSTDIGLVFDDNYYFIGNVPHEYELIPNYYHSKDVMEFFVFMKAAFSVGDSEAGAVLYS